MLNNFQAVSGVRGTKPQRNWIPTTQISLESTTAEITLI